MESGILYPAELSIQQHTEGHLEAHFPSVRTLNKKLVQDDPPAAKGIQKRGVGIWDQGKGNLFDSSEV